MTREELQDFAEEVIRITKTHAHATSVKAWSFKITYDNNLINEEISHKIEEFLEIGDGYYEEFTEIGDGYYEGY
jgi:hypothetical protein